MDHPQCYLRILITPLVSSNSSYLSFVNTYSLLHQINISYISVFLNVEAPCNCCWFSQNILHNQVQCMIYIKLCLCPSIFFHDVYHGHVHGLYLNAKLALKTNFFPNGPCACVRGQQLAFYQLHFKRKFYIFIPYRSWQTFTICVTNTLHSYTSEKLDRTWCNYKEPENFIQRHSPAKILTVHFPPCCTLPVKCKQCQPVNILLVYWC